MEYFIKFQLTTEIRIIAAEIVVLLVLAAIYSAYLNVKAILQGKVKVLNGVQIKMQNVRANVHNSFFFQNYSFHFSTYSCSALTIPISFYRYLTSIIFRV